MRCDSPTFGNCQRIVVVVVEYGMTGIPVCSRHLAGTVRWCMETRKTLRLVDPVIWEHMAEWQENSERRLSNDTTEG